MRCRQEGIGWHRKEPPVIDGSLNKNTLTEGIHWGGQVNCQGAM